MSDHGAATGPGGPNADPPPPPGPDPAPPRSGPLTLEETAGRVGAYRWIEMRLFEVLGGWVATVPELDVKLQIGVHCHHHAWHAELWQQRLPALREMDVARLTAPANDGVAAFMAALAAPDAPDQTIEKLVGTYRVLIPHKVTTYAGHLASASAVSDAAVIRSLRLALADEMEDWREGEALLQSRLATPEDVRRAAVHQQHLETLLVAAGGICGPGPLPIGPP